MSGDGDDRPSPPPGTFDEYFGGGEPSNQPPPRQAREEPPRHKRVAVRPHTDLGNAERLKHLHGDDMRWCADSDSWMVWLGTHWADDTTETTRRWACSTVRRIHEEPDNDDDKLRKSIRDHARKSEASGKLTAMLREARALAGIPTPLETLDRSPMLLNIENGTLDLEKGTLRPHRREDMITRVAGVRHDVKAKCPRWLSFLDRTFGGDADLIGFMQRVVGYGLTASSIEQALIVMHGEGSNGKSTFVEVLFSMLGPYAQSAPRGLLIEKRNEGHPTELARLRGARLVAAMETKQDVKLDEPLVKQLTGGDTITARFMRGNFFEFEPTHTMLMATNYRPRIHGTDYGIWRRVRLVPFAVKIEKAEQDPHLKQKLRAELSGILNWALRGCLDWQREGLVAPSSVKAATDEYREEMDLIGTFIGDCLRKDPDLELDMGRIYSAYTQWCSSSGHHPMSKNKLSREFGRRGFKKVMVQGKRGRSGIGLQASMSWGGG